LDCPPDHSTDTKLQERLPGICGCLAHSQLASNLRYYHCATAVFGACGAGKRIRLPYCLVARTRYDFPNDIGNHMKAKFHTVMRDVVVDELTRCA
jgi:hypothetical protein